jgi:NAD(P)-dependent dehydrogenase (short-subunit alcohol dehydrogenase family)
VRKVVETAREAYGPVEALISNAGFLQQQPFVDLIVEDFDRMISVHLCAAPSCASTPCCPRCSPRVADPTVKSGAID